MIKLRIKSLTCKRHSRSKNPVSTNHGSSAILSATLLTEQQVIPSDSCDVNMEEKQMLTGIILNRLLLPHSPQKEAWSKADKLLYNHLWQLREVRQLYSYPSHCRAQTSSPVNASPWEGAICRDVSPLGRNAQVPPVEKHLWPYLLCQWSKHLSRYTSIARQ